MVLRPVFLFVDRVQSPFARGAMGLFNPALPGPQFNAQTVALSLSLRFQSRAALLELRGFGRQENGTLLLDKAVLIPPTGKQQILSGRKLADHRAQFFQKRE